PVTMGGLKKTYPLVIAPNTLLIPHDEVPHRADFPEDVIDFLLRGDYEESDVVVAPSNEVPTLATVARACGRAEGSVSFETSCLVTVTKHIRRKGIVWAGVVPFERPPSRSKPKEVAALKEDFLRYVRLNPRGLQIFNQEQTLKKIAATKSAEELAL